jgi:hypothetical protein
MKFVPSRSCTAILASLGVLSAVVACSGTETPVVAVASAPTPAPVAIQSCPITNSSIDSLSVKGTGDAFGGATFGTAGKYTYYLAEATAKVAPGDKCAGTIVDLKNTVPDAAGNVSYKFDVVVLTPTDPTKANGTLFYEVNNRTSAPLVTALNDAGGGSDLFTNVKPSVPATVTGTTAGSGGGNGFLMNQGASIVWAGWQGDRPQSITTGAQINATTKWFGPGMTLPTAVDVGKNNAPITGVVQDELIADSATSNLLGTYYKMAPGTLAPWQRRA